jgi:MFS family permease
MKRSKARLCHSLEVVDPDPNTFYLVPNFFIQLVTAKTRVLHHGNQRQGKQLQLCCDLLRSPGLFHLWLQLSDHGSVIGLPSFFPCFGIIYASSRGSSITGAINGVYYSGGAIGCWTISYLADYLGRRRTIQIISVVCMVSAALQAGSVHIAMLLVGRVMNGVSIAWINSIVPTYQLEIAPAAQRGHLVGSYGFIICIGYVRT